MRDLLFIDYALGGCCLIAVIGIGAWIGARRQRQRQRERARRHAIQQTLEVLIEGIQGLVLNLQVLLCELRPDDGLRLRLERLLDEIEAVLAAAAQRSGAERAASDAGQS